MLKDHMYFVSMDKYITVLGAYFLKIIIILNLQNYTYDTENKILNRICALQQEENDSENIDPDIVKGLIEMLNTHNPLVKKIRFARDIMKQYDGIDVSIRIIGANKGDHVQYEMPNTHDLAVLIVGDLTLDNFKRDIIVYTKDHGLQEISMLHPALMALQYPLLLTYAERGYQLGIYYKNTENGKKRKRNRVTMHEYFKYQVHYRHGQPNSYLCYDRLSKQIIVDARALEDQDILQFILKKPR
uniref:Uncharacterized protein n=1 Tax=Arundo donax TaxID=35708 RepID=A0A0A9SZS4_ARUDO